MKFIEGKVIKKKFWTDRLFSLQVDADVSPFKAGQFTQLALEINGEVVGHPYSFVNSSQEKLLEFYFVKVREGRLTEKLAQLDKGDTLLISPHAFGFLCLSEVPDAKYLWLLSTGTGVGPFLSILNTEEPWQRFEKVVLVHAVSHENELSYSDSIENIKTKYGEQFRFIPFVSRSPTDFALQIRIPKAIIEGQLEAHAGIALTPDSSQVMLCGNPNMVKDTTEVLLARGFRKNKRQDAGHITVENYW